MAGFFSKMKEKLSSTEYEAPVASQPSEDEGYVEIGAESEAKPQSKVQVRPYVIEDFEHIKPILESLREGHTIALINIKPLRDKDLVELKRAINKLKKTTDAIEGDIAGFGDDWIAITPAFASIYRKVEAKSDEPQAETVSEVTEYSDEA
tara:strand:+ start:399 stop:848 length:450 start_codon:yes stop_codon:yes gene_type:complete